jgi:DNA (cytosine-5)-methyltransferase 1
MEGLSAEDRAPRLIVLENVYGTLTSHRGKDFSSIGLALSQAGYRFGAIVINARDFVPQSRPRVFFIAVKPGLEIPSSLYGNSADPAWHSAALVSAHHKLPSKAKDNWIWWTLPQPAARNRGLSDLIEAEPQSVTWHKPAETKRLLGMMSSLNKAKVAAAARSGKLTVGCIYRRTRLDAQGRKVQRAEVRFDDVAGCLRTPAGGSSRQTILTVTGRTIKSRLLSTREAARLMGLEDTYKLPHRYNDAYHVAGDGVCVPAVRFLAENLLEPILIRNMGRASQIAA